jgi:ketol-acid reductoisomerase
MGEQTILCGMLQTGAILGYEKMIADGIDAGFASKLIQYGWETITEALKYGGVSGMMDRLSNPAKLEAFALAEELSEMLRPLFRKHMDDIITGEFSRTMMIDWANDDANLLKWRAATAETAFEQSTAQTAPIDEQDYFDKNILFVAMVKAGVELAFESMVEVGIVEESAYYESLHETPLIANTIARKKLYEMNVVISDTAEYGCYLFAHAAVPLLRNWINELSPVYIGKGLPAGSNSVDNRTLVAVNAALRDHPVEWVGQELRGYMKDMKAIIASNEI